MQKLDDDLATLERLALLQQHSDAVAPVQAQINALPKPSAVKSTDKDKIEAARKAYDALAPAEAKALVDASKLVDDENALASLPARKLMDALPAASSITKDNRKQVEKARAAYDALTPAAREQVPAATAKKLFDAEAKLWQLDGKDALTVYTVIFDSNEGSYVASQKVESGKTATKPADPTRNGFTFTGWQLNGKAYDFKTPVTADIRLKATWTKGSGGGEDPAPVDGKQPMYRLYNPNSGEHFYTASVQERNDVRNAGWNYEGIGWYAPANDVSIPVYRVYNAYGGEHHYTTDVSEKNMLVKAGWNYEGIGWYSDPNKAVPLLREYNPNQFSCNHNYTTSQSEHDFLVSIGWRDEGKAWYGVNPPAAASAAADDAAEPSQPLAAAALP